MYLKTAATVEATERGSFSAIAASYSTDRTGERIVRGAFRDTIRRWRRAARDVPLVWDHGRAARDIIGSIDSASMEERDVGLYVEGTLDVHDSELAKEAWRSVRKGRISLSFGYLVEDERTGADGVKELTRLDLMEVTLTSVPANADTQILSAKSAGAAATTSLDEPRYQLPDGAVVSYWGLRDHMDAEARKGKLAAEIRAKTKELEEAERREEVQAAAKAQDIPRSDAPFTDDEGRHLAGCAAPDCDALATNPNGSLRLVPDRRWWCDSHRHLAGEHDHLPEEPAYVPGPNPGSVRLNPNSEKGRRVKAEAERRREKQRQRREADEREAEALAKVRERFEQEATTSIAGLRVRPANVRTGGK